MSRSAEAMLLEALEFSESDRIQIAGKLLETVPQNDPELEAELERWEASLPEPDEKPIISMRLGDSDDADEPGPPYPPPPPLSDAARALLDRAWAASTLDRAIVAQELLGSLPPPPGFVEVTEEQMHAELERRIEEGERDPSVYIPWEQVRDELMRDIDEQQSGGGDKE